MTLWGWNWCGWSHVYWSRSEPRWWWIAERFGVSRAALLRMGTARLRSDCITRRPLLRARGPPVVRVGMAVGAARRGSGPDGMEYHEWPGRTCKAAPRHGEDRHADSRRPHSRTDVPGKAQWRAAQ